MNLKECKKHIINLENRNAGLDRLIDFMRKELDLLQSEVEYKSGEAGRVRTTTRYAEKHHKKKQGTGRKIKNQKSKEKDEYLIAKYTPEFDRLALQYLLELTSRKAYKKARGKVKDIIYDDECLISGQEVYAGFNQADKKEFKDAMKKIQKDEVEKQITDVYPLQYAKEIVDKQKKNIRNKVLLSSYRKIGKAKRIGRDKARIMFPTPK